jgi:hypothetical protein
MSKARQAGSELGIRPWFVNNAHRMSALGSTEEIQKRAAGYLLQVERKCFRHFFHCIHIATANSRLAESMLERIAPHMAEKYCSG